MHAKSFRIGNAVKRDCAAVVSCGSAVGLVFLYRTGTIDGRTGRHHAADLRARIDIARGDLGLSLRVGHRQRQAEPGVGCICFKGRRRQRSVRCAVGSGDKRMGMGIVHEIHLPRVGA